MAQGPCLMETKFANRMKNNPIITTRFLQLFYCKASTGIRGGILTSGEADSIIMPHPNRSLMHINISTQDMESKLHKHSWYVGKPFIFIYERL